MERSAHTDSPYWSEPEVTQLIRDSKTDANARHKLVELVYLPLFKRLEAWLSAVGLTQLNLEASEVFAQLWLRDLQTTIENAVFNDREHFLNTILLRAKQASKRSAKRLRENARNYQSSETIEDVLPSVDSDPAELAEEAEILEKALGLLHASTTDSIDLLRLYFAQGLTIRQIAEERNTPRSTVHHELKRVLEEFRKQLS